MTEATARVPDPNGNRGKSFLDASSTWKVSGRSPCRSCNVPDVTEHFLVQKCALAALSEQNRKKAGTRIEPVRCASGSAEVEAGEGFTVAFRGHGCRYPVDKLLAVASNPLCFSC